MKSVLALALTLSSSLAVLAAPAALAADPTPAAPRCENDMLLRTLGKLAHGKGMRTTRGDDGAVSLALVSGATRTEVMHVSCDTIDVPLARELDVDAQGRPTKGGAAVVRTFGADGGLTLARSAQGALSLDFAPLVLDREAVSIVVMFDDSVSVVRGGKVLYAFARRADGSTSTIEGVGNGCGCERIVARDGTIDVRRLPR